MIVVTGGTGFIGSNIVAQLEARGHTDVVVCDTFGTGDKWKNIAKRELGAIIPPEELFPFLTQNAARIDAIIHMGAISSTTETNVDAIVQNNLKLSQGLWSWCSIHKKRFLYASSAATYGSGAQGFVDNSSPEELAHYRPLNPYGWSKHAFDRWVSRMNTTNVEKPTQCVGFKFFNVYGPNEYHKEGQRSVVHKIVEQVLETGEAMLFESNHKEYPDGGQMRDFVYVEDAVNTLLWFLDNPEVQGLYNVGTGEASTFNELAVSTFKALGYEKARIFYKPMPESLQKHYQNYTQADLTNLRRQGCNVPFSNIEEGVRRYVQDYILKEDPYL